MLTQITVAPDDKVLNHQLSATAVHSAPIDTEVNTSCSPNNDRDFQDKSINVSMNDTDLTEPTTDTVDNGTEDGQATLAEEEQQEEVLQNEIPEDSIEEPPTDAEGISTQEPTKGSLERNVEDESLSKNDVIKPKPKNDAQLSVHR